MDIDKLKKVVKESKTLSDTCKKMGCEGSYGNIKRLIKKYSINISHFTQVRTGKEKRTCPVCEKVFEAWPHNKKVTCGYSCSNTHFRTGVNNGQWKDSAYRTTCFSKHEKKCVICGEDKIVAVHHYDGNHKNNDITNLIPLCPTHHKYMHSGYKNLIEDQVNKYVNNFIGI